MKRLVAVSVLLLSMSLVSAGRSARPFPAPDPPVVYELVDEAFFEEGCFSPCLCPIYSLTDFLGTFGLEPADDEGSWEVYTISDAVWEMSSDFGIARRATGSGILRIDTDRGLQRLQMDLQLDGEDVRQFDSGVVPLEAEWPALSVRITEDDLYCFDTVFHVKAEPATGIGVDAPTRWSTLKTSY